MEAKMKKSYILLVTAATCLVNIVPYQAKSQVKIDISSDDARKAAAITTIDDLSVHDSALIYESYCIKDEALYVPGWTRPADLASSNYPATGLMLRIEVLPGKRLKGTLVDAAKAQQVAKGNASTTSTMSKDEYNSNIISIVNRILDGGDWGVKSCEFEKNFAPLKVMNLYSIDSINGHTKLSELLASARKASK
jgi:hypothetical protein